MNQSSSLNNQNQFVYVNPAEDPKCALSLVTYFLSLKLMGSPRMFSYFPDNVHLQPILPQPEVNNSLASDHISTVGSPAINGMSLPILTP
jgi:hypothetical protein